MDTTLEGTPRPDDGMRDTERRNGQQNTDYAGETPAETARTVLVNQITWSAVFAGVAVSLVSQLLLNMIGIGIGLGTIDPGTADNPAAGTLSMSAGIWWAVSGIIAAAFGGYAAGRLSGRPEQSTAAWHGLVSWAFATLAVAYLLTSTMSSIVGGAVSSASSVVNGSQGGIASKAVSPTITQAAVPFAPVEQRFRADAGDQSAVRDLATASLRSYLTAGPIEAPQLRERAVADVGRALNLSPEQASPRVTAYEQQYRQEVALGSQTASRAANAAASAASWGSILGAIALALGAIAAWWAGGSAAVHPTMRALASHVRAQVQTRRTA